MTEKNRISLRGALSTTNPTGSDLGLNPIFSYQKSTSEGKEVSGVVQRAVFMPV
jgi:hypothetical protein